MKRVLLVAAVMLSSAAGFAIRSLSLKAPVAPAAEASAQNDEERWYWEYAAVVRAQFAPSPRGGQYWIVYFGGDGVKTTTVDSGVGGNAQGKAIATLGASNWEMIGEGTLDTGRPAGRDEPPRALLFKRRWR